MNAARTATNLRHPITRDPFEGVTFFSLCHFTAFPFFLVFFDAMPAAPGGGGVGGRPAVLMTTSGGGFFLGGFLAFRRPSGFGGGLLTSGFKSSSSFRLRFVPPLGAGRRLLDVGFGSSSSGPRCLLTPFFGGIIFERMAIAVARFRSAPMSFPSPTDLSGFSALRRTACAGSSTGPNHRSLLDLGHHIVEAGGSHWRQVWFRRWSRRRRNCKALCVTTRGR